MKNMSCSTIGALAVFIAGLSVAQETHSYNAECRFTPNCNGRTVSFNDKTRITLSKRLLTICKNSNTTKEEIESLVLIGADVLYKDDAGVTPLIAAAYYIRDSMVIATLLEAGSDVNAATKFEAYTPILAAAYGHQGYEVFKLLLDSNANVTLREKSGENALHPLLEDRQSVEVVSLLINAGVNINERGTYEMTPLMVALEANASLNVIKTLIQAGADVQALSTDKFTPLYYASVYSESLEVIDLLIEHGADLQSITYGGTTLVLSAITHGRPVEIVQKLVDSGADVKVRSYGFSALHLAARGGSPKLVQFILDQGFSINERNIKGGATPLMVAAEWNKEPNVLGVLIRAGADVNMTNTRGQTALMLASRWMMEEGSSKILNRKKEILLIAGALMDAKCSNGMSFVEYEKQGKRFAEFMNNSLKCGGAVSLKEFE